MAGTFKQSNYKNHTTSAQCAVGEEKLYANTNIKKGSLKDKTGMYQTPPVQHTEREEKLEVAKATKSRSNNPKKINLEPHDQRSNKNTGIVTSGENKREKTTKNSPLKRPSSETGSIFRRPFTGHKPNHNSFPKSAPYVTMKQKLKQTKSSSNSIGPIFTSTAVCDGKETDKEVVENAKKSEKESLTLATEPVKGLRTLAQSKENCKLQCTPSSRRLSLTDGKGETLQKLPDKCETTGDRQLENDCVLNQKVMTIDDHNKGYCLGRAICPLREGRRFVDLKTAKTNSSWEELEPMLTASPVVWNTIEDQMVDSGRLLVEQFGKCIVMPNNQSNAKSTEPDRLLKTKVSPVVGCNNKAIYLLSLKELSGQSVQARSHLYSETSGDSFVGKMLINDFESASQTPCPSNTYILQNLKPAKPFCDDKKPTVQMNCDFASMTRGTQTGRFNRKSCDSCLCPFTVPNQKGVGTKSHSKPTYSKAIIAPQEQSGQTNEDSDHCLIVDGNYDYEPLAPYTASVGEQKRIEKERQSVFELVKNQSKKQIKSSSAPKTKQLINKTCDCHAPLLEKSKKHLRRHRSTPRRQVSLQDLSNDRHESQHLHRPKSITREAFGNFELKSNHIDLPVKLRKVNNTSPHVSPKNFQKHLHHVDTPTTHTEKSNKPVGDRPNESSDKLYMLNSRTENEIDQKDTSIQHWLQSASFDHTSTGTLQSIPAIENSTLINPIKHIGEPNPIDHKTHESTQLQKDEHATDVNASGTDLSPTTRTIHVVERMLHKSIKETEREADKGTSGPRAPDDANVGRSNTKGQTLWPEWAIRSDTPLRKRGSAPGTNIALARGSPKRVAAAVSNSAGRKSKSKSNGRLLKQTRPYQNAFISMRDHSVRIRSSCSRILITFCVTLVILESVALWVYILWYLANTSLTSVGGFFSPAQEESDLQCDESDPEP